MKKINLWFKLLIRQWSWYNDRKMLYLYSICSVIISIIFSFIVVESSFFVMLTYTMIFCFVLYHVFKFVSFFVLCGLIVAFIEDRRFQALYIEMYNWRQSKENNYIVNFNVKGEDYVEISRSVGDN